MKAGGCVQVGSNPQPRADLTGGGVRIGHDSAAEVLQDVRGPPGPLCTVRAAEVLRAGCGPPGAVRAGRSPGKHSKWLSICKISGALARMLFPIPGL